MKAEQIIKIARSYLSLNDQLPPMIIGADDQEKPLALVGLFRDFQEQITFCAVVRMAFIINSIKNYHILTHGFMRDDLTNNSSESEEVKEKSVNKLIQFLGR